MDNLRDIASKCLLLYLQSWGQSVEERISALNAAVAAAGIESEFRQGLGVVPGWYGGCERSAILAAEFRTKLNDVWCGEFNQEVTNIVSLIEQYRRRSQEMS